MIRYVDAAPVSLDSDLELNGWVLKGFPTPPKVFIFKGEGTGLEV